MALMESRISQALRKIFERNRIVFWYDVKHELRSDFDAIALPNIEKLELTNNAYGLKYRMLREAPEQKFLVYHEGPQPEDLDNWLLDVQLAHGEFRTDQVAIWLSELELGLEFAPVVQAHTEFFQANKRKESLKKLLHADDTSGIICLKLLAVCSGSEPRIDSMMENLLQELAEGRDEKIKLITRCNLDVILWQQLSRNFGYSSDAPGIEDFVIELFKSCYAMATDGSVKLSGDALVFLKRWKDSRQFESGFEILSDKYAEVLGIEQDLATRDFRKLSDLDYFRLIDQKVISDLVAAVTSRTVSSGEVALWIRQRRQGHWYQKYQFLYEAIDYAAQFLQSLSDICLAMDSLAEGVQRYCRSWYQIDQLYRKFTYNYHKSKPHHYLDVIALNVDNLYTNNYLLKLGDLFQVFVENAKEWEAPPIQRQDNFFEHWVRPYLNKENKVCVIISDAMRYEIGDELHRIIRQEDRYSAELASALSMLPSYTQLGMAALLPNKALEIMNNETGTVLVDGQSSQGTENRTKILNNSLDGRGVAVRSNDFMGMSRESSRDLFKDNDVIYIYHNRIDHTGDKMHTEGEAFAAVEQTLDDLLGLVKKLTATNVTNLLITADHGFIYQDRAIEESDYSSVDASGDVVLYRDRRFIIGNGLNPSNALHTFTNQKIGLVGSVEIQIPKSINRLRLRGSGSRFVHGGATLQEVVVPIIRINKKRQSDVTVVEVDILRGASLVITSGQLAVMFYQAGPVTDKIQSRILRAGIYTESGDLISDSHELIFDLTSENAREREFQVRFLLSREADAVNGREVILRLDEKHAETSHFKEYKSLRYTMRRSFTSDF